MALFFNKKKKNVKSSNSILTEKQRQKILVKANSLIRGISDSRENLSFPEYDKRIIANPYRARYW